MMQRDGEQVIINGRAEDAGTHNHMSQRTRAAGGLSAAELRRYPKGRRTAHGTLHGMSWLQSGEDYPAAVFLLASEFAAIQVVPSSAPNGNVCAAVAFYVRAARGLLLPRVSDMLARRNRSGRIEARTGIVPDVSSRPPLSAGQWVFPSTAGRLAYQAGPAQCVCQLKPAPGMH
jgi:hypothetical protein